MKAYSEINVQNEPEISEIEQLKEDLLSPLTYMGNTAQPYAKSHAWPGGSTTHHQVSRATSHMWKWLYHFHSILLFTGGSILVTGAAVIKVFSFFFYHNKDLDVLNKWQPCYWMRNKISCRFPSSAPGRNSGTTSKLFSKIYVYMY